MVPRLAGVAALLFAATLVFAQNAQKIKIEFAGEGTREVWIQEKGKHGVLSERTSVSGKAVEIDVPAGSAEKLVYVHDVTTGNVATKALDQVVKSGTWTVKGSDETHAFTVVFMVAHDDAPLTAALVRIKAGGESRETLLTAKDAGLAAFFVVPFGDVEVTVEYESDGADKSLAAQVFEAKAGMASQAPFVLKIDDDVETVAPAAAEEKSVEPAGEKETEEDKEPAPKGNPISTLLSMLLGLGVIGGVSYAIWRYVKANPDKAADILQKGGVHVPGDQQGSAAMPPKKAGPPPQILLDDATPTAGEPVIGAGAIVKNPRLVKADGSLYIVQDGEQTVGRDEGCGLPLTGESSVSRNHSKITKSGDLVTIEDLASTNGTFVNGQKVTGTVSLNPGDSVQFGAVQYKYEV